MGLNIGVPFVPDAADMEGPYLALRLYEEPPKLMTKHLSKAIYRSILRFLILSLGLQCDTSKRSY